MISVAEKSTSDSVTIAVWVGFAMMCIGMFMAVLDVRSLRVSADHPARVKYSTKSNQLDPDRLFDRRSHLDSAHRFPDTRADNAMALRRRHLDVYPCIDRLCRKRQLFDPNRVSDRARDFRWHPNPSGLFGRLLAFSISAPAVRNGDRRGSRRPCSDRGTDCRRLDYRDIFLAVAIPDQCRTGIIAALVATVLLPKAPPSFDQIPLLDLISLGLGATALATLEIAIKEAPERGWGSSLVAALLSLCLITALGFVFRTLRSQRPLVDLRTFRDRNFSIGCLFSFLLGMGLFGSVYLMPVFLAYVRAHNALEIGKIMLVTGVAQLAIAPIAVILVRRVDVRLLTGFGFLLFAFGLGLSSVQTSATDFDEMLWPQLVRGSAIMFCILSPTQVALGHLAKTAIADASGLFNLMRNLGGAIGIAIIDTVIYTRAPEHARTLVGRLTAGDLDTVKLLGIPPTALGPALLDPEKQAVLASLVKKVAFVDAVNDAWALVALTTLAALVVVPWIRGAPD